MSESPDFPTLGELSQLRSNCEYHRDVACMVHGGHVVALLDELERLRKINHELVCSHNDLLVVVSRLEAAQPPLRGSFADDGTVELTVTLESGKKGKIRVYREPLVDIDE